MLRTAWFPAVAALILGLWVYTRFWPDRRPDTAPAPGMPAKVTDTEEDELYLVPGGKYTTADIAANGHTTASERYPRFRARHDHDPAPGDRICPVTRTKADPRCAWTIDGKVYLFCCPPCIDEFVRLAKEQPGRVEGPQAYVRR